MTDQVRNVHSSIRQASLNAERAKRIAELFAKHLASQLLEGPVGSGIGVNDATDYLLGGTVQDLNSGVNARRARLGVTGKFAGDWNYTLIYDFGGSTDAAPGAAGSGIQTAMVTYNGLNKGPLPLAFDIGYMDTPFKNQTARRCAENLAPIPSSAACARSL